MGKWTKLNPVVEIKKTRKINLVQVPIPVQEIKSSTGKLSLKISAQKEAEIKEKLSPKRIEVKPETFKKYPQKFEKNNDIIALLRYLEKQYPKVFNFKKRTKPLKIGIAEDIFAAAKNTLDEVATEDQHKKAKALIKKSLTFYCSSTVYLKSTVEGKPRYDLEGNECGVVDAEQEKWAKKRLADLTKIFKKKNSTVNASKF